jgi:hypothetical protein
MTTPQDTTQAATFSPEAKTKWTRSHRKEGKCFLDVYQIINTDPASAHGSSYGAMIASVPVELRIYGTGGSNTACLWVNADPLHTQGSGRAGGCGYHRGSAAAGAAISNAGFALAKSINGVGDSAIEEALCAIAKAIGIKSFVLTHAHA